MNRFVLALVGAFVLCIPAIAQDKVYDPRDAQTIIPRLANSRKEAEASRALAESAARLARYQEDQARLEREKEMWKREDEEYAARKDAVGRLAIEREKLRQMQQQAKSRQVPSESNRPDLDKASGITAALDRRSPPKKTGSGFDPDNAVLVTEKPTAEDWGDPIVGRVADNDTERPFVPVAEVKPWEEYAAKEKPSASPHVNEWGDEEVAKDANAPKSEGKSNLSSPEAFDPDAFLASGEPAKAALLKQLNSDKAAEEKKTLAAQRAAAIHDKNLNALRIIGIICVLGVGVWKWRMFASVIDWPNHPRTQQHVAMWKRATHDRVTAWKRAINTPGRLKAIYLVWLFLNLMMLLFSPHPFGVKPRRFASDPNQGQSYGNFYPFTSSHGFGGNESGVYFHHVEEYDITEFMFYCLAPLVFWQAARMWQRDSQVVRAGFPEASVTVNATKKAEVE